MKKPNFFIVGAPKCGTTALYAYLKQHPQVFMSEVKEPHFFGSDLEVFSSFSCEKDYLSLFSEAGDKKCLGEASTSYLYSKLAAKEISEFCLHAKIIIMLRNPVDMMYSLHQQRLYRGIENVEDFKHALELEEKRKKGLCLPNKIFPKGLLYREMAKYSSQIERYFNIFGHDNVHVIIWEDFHKNPMLVYQHVCQFLEISTEHMPIFEVVNANKKLRSNILHNFYNFLRNSLIIHKIFTSVIPNKFLRMLTNLYTDFNIAYSPRPPLDKTFRQQMQQEFTHEIEKLSCLLNKDLSYWCKD